MLAVGWLFVGTIAVGAPSTSALRGPAVAHLVDSYFAALPDYRAGDLISRSQIEGAIRTIEAAGGKVKNADELVERGLADDSFLIRELSSPAGKKFMRKVGRNVGGYARLDRLSTIAGGQKLVRDLLHGPGGDAMVEYLTTTQGGSNMGRMLGGARGGVDLNKPTGRIYTAVELIAELQQRVTKAKP
jgi:hypothetical protein